MISLLFDISLVLIFNILECTLFSLNETINIRINMEEDYQNNC